MRKIFLIAARDYSAAVRTKSFLVGLLFVPILMLGGMVFPLLMRGKMKPESLRFAVVDRTPGQAVRPAIEAVAHHQPPTDASAATSESRATSKFILEWIDPCPDTKDAVESLRLALSERVKAGELTGFLEIGPDVLTAAATPDNERAVVRYQSNVLVSDGFPRLATEAVNGEIRKRRSEALGLSWDQVKQLEGKVRLKNLGLSRRDVAANAVTEADEGSRIVAIIIPVALLMVMFMMVFSGSTPLLQSVAEEKGWRVAELLLSSVRPSQLMAGKLIGNIAVTLTTMGVYVSVALVAAYRFGYDQLISPSLLGWFVLFQVLGVILYGSLFMAIGAACNDSKQIQSLLLPITMLAVSPMFALAKIVQDPTSPIAAWLSYFPFATPMLMVFRITIPPGVAWWEPVLGAAILLLTAALCVYAAGRVFRLGLLMQGKGADVRQMIRWAVRG